MTVLASPSRASLRDGSVLLERLWSLDRTPILQASTSVDSIAGAVGVLQREFALRKRLINSWAAVPIELVHRLDHTELRLADPGGDLLRPLCARRLSIEEVLSIGCGVASAVAGMHAAELVHRDLCPDNILFNPETGTVSLTGFGN